MSQTRTDREVIDKGYTFTQILEKLDSQSPPPVTRDATTGRPRSGSVVGTNSTEAHKMLGAAEGDSSGKLLTKRSTTTAL